MNQINLFNDEVKKFYLGESDCKIYLGETLLYPKKHCQFYVVERLEDYDGDAPELYVISESRWYMRNNLGEYEPYGIIGDDLNTTTYIGKLVIYAGHEYEWDGKKWVDLGDTGGKKTLGDTMYDHRDTVTPIYELALSPSGIASIPTIGDINFTTEPDGEETAYRIEILNYPTRTNIFRNVINGTVLEYDTSVISGYWYYRFAEPIYFSSLGGSATVYIRNCLIKVYYVNTESDGTIIKDYAEKEAPLFEIEFETYDEMMAYECPWKGLVTYVGKEKYVYGDEGWELQVEKMFTRTHLDGTTFEVDCGKSGTTLTSTITSANTTIQEITGDTNPVTAFTIGDCVEKIEQKAFKDWRKVQGDLVIPDSVTEFGLQVFAGCSGFNGTLTLPSGLTNIGSWTFSGCTGFTGDLVIPSGVTEIGVNIFYNCRGFNGTLTLPSGVTSFGTSAFYNCGGLIGDLVIPDSVTEIGGSAFRGCSGFTGDLVIPDSVTEIGDSVFANCIGFNGTLTLPSGLTSIDKYVFSGCTGLIGDLVIPSGVTSIGSSAFYGCSGFNGTLTLPSGLTSIGYSAFTNCSGFDGTLDLPSGLTSINGSAFYGCSGFTGNLVIPDSVTSIGSSAFRGCSGFDGTLDLHSGITEIGNFAFNDCSGFTGTLDLPSGLTSIGDSAFRGCSGFTGDLVIPDSVTSIGTYSFAYCSGFNGTLTLPSGVTEINAYAFYFCSGLKTIYIKSEIPPTLGNSTAFAYTTCPIYVPCGTADIYKTATNWTEFANRIVEWNFDNDTSCSGVGRVPMFTRTHLDGTTFNAAMCGENGTTLTTAITRTNTTIAEITGDTNPVTAITISECVEKIGDSVFSGWTKVVGELVIPDSVTSIGTYAFNDCSGFTGNLVIPSGVTEIGTYAFAGCSGFNGTLTLPSGLTKINKNTFQRCGGFTGDLVIPSGVTEIGNYAFYYCSGFDGIYVKSEIPPILSTYVFYRSTCPIYVPCGTGDLYKSATNWSEYADRIQEYNYEQPNLDCEGNRIDEDLSLRKLKLNIAMTIDKKNESHIIAEDGKVFRRKSDGLIYGNEIYLGYTYYIDGKLLDEPHLEVPEDFEEIDEPKEENGGEE